MKRIALLLIAFGLFVAFGTPVLANGYVLGAGGYYWLNGVPYTRTWHDGYYFYDAYGCRYYQAGYYEYTQTTYTPPVTPSDPNWRTKLLEIAAQRDKVEGDLRKAALEQKYFSEAVNALGLSGNFRWNGYGQHIGYGYQSYGNNSLLYGASASTVYGTTLNTQTDLYGQLDINSLFQQANLLTKRQQDLNGDAMAKFADLVAQAGADQAQVAKIRARAQAIALLAEKLEMPSAKITTTKTTFGSGTAPAPVVTPQPQPDPNKLDVKALWEASATANCLKCHGGKDAAGKVVLEGNFDVTKVASMPRDRKAKIMERLTTSDVNKRMPRGTDPLDEDEKSLWMLYLSQ